MNTRKEFNFNFSQLPHDKLWFTSDSHFSHTNIIKYCNRPFDSVEEMNEKLIENWNSVIGKDDLIFCLGDFALGSEKQTRYILERLNGHKVLIKGNHEKSVMCKDYNRNEFNGGIYEILEIKVNDDEVANGFQHIVLCHYTMFTFHNSHRGTWQLFGHVHGRLDGDSRISPNQIDVGVDSHNYTPINYKRVKEIITKNNLERV